jgi:hypothetical protein
MRFHRAPASQRVHALNLVHLCWRVIDCIIPAGPWRVQVRDQLQLLLKIAPEWCSVTPDPMTGAPIFCVNPHAPTGPVRERLRALRPG